MTRRISAASCGGWWGVRSWPSSGPERAREPPAPARAPSPSATITPIPPRPAPKIAAAPDNQLTWPSQGYRPPKPIAKAAKAWYVREAGRGGVEVRRHTLWSGPLPDSRWALLEQYWTAGAGRWNTVLLIGQRDGAKLHAAYEAVTTFNHQRRRESASLSNNQVERIAGYGFGFADFVLVIGGPKAEKASITLDGRKVLRERLVQGAAVFKPVDRGPVELFQLRDRRGRLLTPNDYQGAKYDRRGKDAVIQGWTLDRR